MAFIRILTDCGIAPGSRRIVAVTGERAVEEAAADAALLTLLGEQLRAPKKELLNKLIHLEDRVRELSDEVKSLERGKLAESVEDISSEEEVIGAFHVLTHVFSDFDAEQLREAGDRFRDRLGEMAVVVLASALPDKVLWLAMVAPGAVKKGMKAGDLVREAAKITGGGGGGRPDMAQAGGRDVSQVDVAFEAIRSMIREI